MNNLLTKSRTLGDAVLLIVLLSHLSLVTGDAAGTVVAWGYNDSGQTNVPSGLINVEAIASGYYHSLALTGDGRVVAWGGDSFGQPADLTNVVAIAAGYHHSLALKSNGTVAAWGFYYQGPEHPPMTVPMGLDHVTAIAAGSSHSLALKADGTMVAWGNNRWGQNNVPAGLANVLAIAAGDVHSLALKSDGRVYAWGDNQYGQTNVPAGLSNVVAIAGGGFHSLAVKSDGTVVSWGRQVNVPAGLSNVVALAAGSEHSLALKSDGTVVAWGSSGFGVTMVPTSVTNGVAVAAGWVHSLVLVGDGSPVFAVQPATQRAYIGADVVLNARAAGGAPVSYQWQFNGTNILSETNSSLVLSDVQLPDDGSYSVTVSNVLGVVASRNAILTVLATVPAIHFPPQDQVTFPGGSASFQVVADGAQPLGYQWRFEGTDLPAATNTVLTLRNVTASQAGRYSVVVSSTLGSTASSDAILAVVPVADWGSYYNGSQYVPMTVPADLTNVTAIAAGYNHRLALKSDGTVAAWGSDYNGSEYVPMTVPAGLDNVAAIATGIWHSMALKSNGTVVAWGGHISAQTNVPVGLSNVVAIAGGAAHSLALKSDGTVIAWGFAEYDNTDVPSALTNVVAIAAGYSHSLALKGDGRVVAWGDNQTYVPPGLIDVIAIAAGQFRSLALKGDGTVVAWPYSGVPAGLTNVVAISSGNLALGSDGTVSWGYAPAGLSNVVAIAGDSLALIGDGSPVFAPQAAVQIRYTGADIVLNANALGAPPLSYQWQFNGTNLSNATNSSLVLSQAQWADAGTYVVVVSNTLGVFVGRSVTLIVTESSPVIFGQPTNLVSFRGGTATFQIIADGSRPLAYQWRLEGISLPGATNAVLALDNVTYTQAGKYSVAVSNALGSTTSSNATLAVVSVAAWGANFAGQTDVPPGLSNVVAVAAGLDQSIALKSDGTVMAWGGQTDVPAGLGNVVAIAAGGHPGLYCGRHSYGLALTGDGRVVGLGAYAPADLSNVVAIAASSYHSLALKSDGTVVAWRLYLSPPDPECEPDFGQSLVPVGLTNVVAIAAGWAHSLALRNDGTLVAWGAGATNSSSWPELGQSRVPAGLTNVMAIAAGLFHSLALKSDSTVAAWGYDDYGQTDVPPGLSNVVAIAAGGEHSLALKSDGTVVAWGNNSWGQTNVPPGLSNVVAIAGGPQTSLALVGDGPPVLTTPLSNPLRRNAMFSVSLPTRSGRVYLLEYKDSLADPLWTILPLVPGNGLVRTLTDSSATVVQRFYRVRQW